MTEEQEQEPVEAVETPEESPQDSGLAAFAAMEAERGLGLDDDDEYAAKDSDEADAPEDEASNAGEPDTAAEESAPSDDADPAEREAAIRALRRAKTPQSVIDSLSDSELLEWGADLSKIQQDVDSKLSAKPASEPDEDDDQPTEPAANQPAGPVAWDEVIAPLKDTFGDDDAEAMVAPMRAVYDALQSKNQVLENAVETLLLKESFRQLESKWPQLAEPDQQSAVRDKAASLNQEQYQSWDDLISDAARLALGDPRDAVKEKRSSVSRKRSASQTRSSNRKVATQPASDFDSGYESFKALEDKYGLG